VSKSTFTHRGAVVALLLQFACLGVLLFPMAARAATELHLFDATISLTGTCSTESLDEVADPWCPGPPAPSSGFSRPNIAIDSFGDMYVSSHEEPGSAGRVDVFSPEGEFITEVQVSGARSLAVDSQGNLYVHQFVAGGGLRRVVLLRPSTYLPEAGEIAYSGTLQVVVEGPIAPGCSVEFAPTIGLAVNSTNDHLFISPGSCVGEWSSPGASPDDGPTLLDTTIGSGVLTYKSTYVAVDATRNRLYVSDVKDPGNPLEGLIKVFELEAPHAYLGSLDGHNTPNGKFLAREGYDAIDVDEASGHLIVSELRNAPVVYELGLGLDAEEDVLNTYEYEGFEAGPSPLEVAVDNSPTSPNYRTFFVPSEGTQLQHTFAFRFTKVEAPVADSAVASGVTETEAVLNATIDPNGAETDYRIEYTSAASGFDGAALAGAGTLPAGIGAVPVSAPVTGLAPGTTYRFRVVAENDSGTSVAEGSFRTYASSGLGGPCPNDVFRFGLSANLPDCRAYELVTPPDTNGRAPRGPADTAGLYFPTLLASPDGTKATFRIEGGTIPGFDGSGSFNGDNYLAKRGAEGWTTELISAHGTDALNPNPGGVSPDQEYAFWNSDNPDSPRFPWIRYPDGHSERVGRGSLAIDPFVAAKLISQNGSHTIFGTVPSIAIRLEPAAPAAGTAAVYDRTSDEVTHVVSLLPGDVTPAPGNNAQYIGASLDGEGIAFKLQNSSMLYLRQRNQVTYEVGEGLTYAGIAEGGGRIFYLKSGNLFAFDTTSHSAIQFSKGGDTTPVNISADGSTAYFISPDVLTAKKTNPIGSSAKPEEENLYASREGQITFVGTVEPLDVKEPISGQDRFAGLGRWVIAVEAADDGGKPAVETSRLTPDGRTLLFEARAPLTGYQADGHKEIYRYDLSGPSLTCLSCNPTGVSPTTDASLQTLPRQSTPAILGLATRMLNVRPDGNRAFFQSQEALVPSDVDSRQDVYEWEAQGVGSCTSPDGCIYLISFGQSDRDEHLFAVSESGDDAFFLSGSQLLARDKESTESLYDARVGGGFAEAAEEAPCQGEGCKSTLNSPPALPAPATPDLGKNGNVRRPPCGKGKRKIRRHGKVRCVKKRHHRHHRHSSAKRGTSK